MASQKKKRIRYLELDPQQHRIFLTLLAVFEKVGRLHRLLDDGRRGVAFFSLKRNPKPKNNKTKKNEKKEGKSIEIGTIGIDRQSSSRFINEKVADTTLHFHCTFKIHNSIHAY